MADTDKNNFIEMPASPVFWVGIGASAGGLEALRGLVRQLPTELPATYIVAQHMAPHHKSLLAEIIGRETSMEVYDVADNLTPLPNTIYICPSNANIIVDKGKLKLLEPSKEFAAPKPIVDLFFQSLAADQGTQAIAIILSGTGSDGAKGIRAIHQHGGITVAQDEHTAKYPGMPLAALETGDVDLVLSPEELGAQFATLTATPRDLSALSSVTLTSSALAELNRLIYNETKVDFNHYKTATIQRRVERRMAAVGTTDLEQYVDIATNSIEEVHALFKDLLISVTSFFRDTAEFTALRKHIEDLVAERQGQDIRVWVAGVATGEEAYSIAILFAEVMGGLKQLASSRLQIFATDIDVDAIAKARRGYYTETTLVAVPKEYIERYFDPSPNGYTVRKLLREKIIYSIHNVAKDSPFLNLDLISCRNLLIYFQLSLQANVFDRFHYSLKDKGVLFLGKSEATTASSALFRPADQEKHVFYRRTTEKRRRIGDTISTTDIKKLSIRKPRGQHPEDLTALVSQKSQFDSLVRALGPNALLLSREQQILSVFGNVNQFIGINNTGVISTNTTSLVLEPWLQDIRIAIPKVVRQSSNYTGVTRVIDEKTNTYCRLKIYPIEDVTIGETIVLVVFKQWVEEKNEKAKALPENDGSPLLDVISKLREELEIARSNLQIAVEELGTSNEELQAVNEEMQSSNEELQSTNEELETTNEELQSTNEELSTVNDELQVNAQQLNLVNQSMRSILDNVTVPMLVLDSHMFIIDASLSAAKFFNIPVDLVEPHVSRCVMPEGFPDINSEVKKAFTASDMIKTHVFSDDLSATLIICPYYTAIGDLVGVIVQVVDNSEAIKRVKKELELIFDHAPVGLLLRTESGVVINANNKAHQLSGLKAHELIGKNTYEYLPQDYINRLKKLEKSRKESKLGYDESIIPFIIEGQEPKWFKINHVPFNDSETSEPMVLTIIEDHTEKHKEQMLTDYLKTGMELALSASNIGVWEYDMNSNNVDWSLRFKKMMRKPDDFTPSIQSLYDLVHPEDKKRVHESSKKQTSGELENSASFRVVLDDGSVHWLREHWKSTTEEGSINRRIGIVIDETEVKAHLEQVISDNRHLQLAEKLSKTGYWSVHLDNNRNEKHAYWSDEIYKIYGLERENFTPTYHSILALYHEEDREFVVESFNNAIDQLSGFDFTARIIHTSGDPRIIHTLGIVQAEDNHNQKAMMFGVFQDITERIEKENSLKQTSDELRRSNEELNRFSYVCSHDMKEPVRLIESMSEMLQEPDIFDDEDQTKQLLSRINRNTKRLRGIIDSLLAYSRVDAKIVFEKISLNQVVADIRENYALILEDVSPDLIVEDLPDIYGSYVHFTQLIQNLIGNALKYSHRENTKIKISAISDQTTHLIVVEDNGPGISTENRTVIFDVFTRLEINSKSDGSGLGLAICKRIVQQYGGNITCTESGLGGAKFTISLPVYMEH